ncbi:uncharacterized protein LOC113125251 [Mastacembelus armatus]|uniref:uncharacterized protein LOC113125251 n=1 Tax=Mastacembelus armatus TaxID=205130 RepID=UPI001436BA04|nr:uncharacterized protein LOC113125251 [Mastacembelus armatus]
MEESSRRLYSGPLSQAAQKILIVLRSQSLQAARHDQRYSSNHRQMERYYGSHWEHCALSSRNMSREERRDRNTDHPQFSPQVSTNHCDPSNERQSSQTLANCQYSQTPNNSMSSQAFCSPSSWDFSPQRRMSKADAYYQHLQTYGDRNYSDPPSCQSSQTLSLSQHEASEAAASLSHRDRYTLSLQIPKRRSEHHLWRNSSEEISSSSGVEDRGNQCQESESESVKSRRIHLSPRCFVTGQKTGSDSYTPQLMTKPVVEEELEVNSNSVTITGIGQMSNTEQELEDDLVGVRWEEMNAILPHERRTASELEGGLLLRMYEETSLKNSYMVSIRNMDKRSNCNTGGVKLEKKESNECKVKTCENKEQPPDSQNKAVSAGYHEVLFETMTKTAKEDHIEGQLVQCVHTRMFLGDTAVDDLERTTDEEVDVERTQEFPYADSEDEMEMEPPHCSDVQIRKSLCEAECRDLNELLRGQTRLGENEIDRVESVMTPVDSEDVGISPEDSVRDRCPSPASFQECGARRSVFKTPCVNGNQQQCENVQYWAAGHGLPQFSIYIL